MGPAAHAGQSTNTTNAGWVRRHGARHNAIARVSMVSIRAGTFLLLLGVQHALAASSNAFAVLLVKACPLSATTRSGPQMTHNGVRT